MSAYEKKSTPDLGDTSKYPNIANKFRAYRMEAESRERKLKEAESLIQQLKDEIIFSRNSEKNLRSQILSTQNRLICVEKTLIKFIEVANQQQEIEKTFQHIEQRIKGIDEKITKTRQESQDVFQYVSRDTELLKKIQILETALKTKTSECDLMKMDIQTLTKEKENLETEHQEKTKTLQEELDKSVKKEEEALARYRETLIFYKQQIEDYEQKIERYEKDRKSFLEDFEPPKTSLYKSEKFTLADSTVTEERFPQKQGKTQPLNELDTQIFQCSSLPGKPKVTKYRKGKEQSLHKIPNKQKPQLEFLTQPQNSSPIVNTVECGQKRRLFSTNCNHYTD